MRILLCAACALLLAGCSIFSDSDDADGPAAAPPPVELGPATASSSSDDASNSTSDADDADANGNRPRLGVNGYLWRAVLDTLDFMPLQSEDAVGGVIITEWYSAPETPAEKMKVTAYILDRRLRADALKVSVFRQVRGASGWVDAPVNPGTSTKLEDAILSRARELRLASTGTDQ